MGNSCCPQVEDSGTRSLGGKSKRLSKSQSTIRREGFIDDTNRGSLLLFDKGIGPEPGIRRVVDPQGHRPKGGRIVGKKRVMAELEAGQRVVSIAYS
jgi:hypothetical protein